MVSWKLKYLKYKFKFQKLINQKGGMNSSSDAERLNRLIKTFKNNHRIRELISEVAANSNARELYNKKKEEILDEIRQEYKEYINEEDKGLENLMLRINIKWKDIPNIENANVDDINDNLNDNYNYIVYNIGKLIDDY